MHDQALQPREPVIQCKTDQGNPQKAELLKKSRKDSVRHLPVKAGAA